MENVPAYVCDRCGERYYDAHVAKQMRKLSTLGKTDKEENIFHINSLRRQESDWVRSFCVSDPSESESSSGYKSLTSRLMGDPSDIDRLTTLSIEHAQLKMKMDKEQ